MRASVRKALLRLTMVASLGLAALDIAYAPRHASIWIFVAGPNGVEQPITRELELGRYSPGSAPSQPLLRRLANRLAEREFPAENGTAVRRYVSAPERDMNALLPDLLMLLVGTCIVLYLVARRRESEEAGPDASLGSGARGAPALGRGPEAGAGRLGRRERADARVE